MLLGFIALAVLLFRDAWASPATRWVGQAGDPPLFMWFLKWTPHALRHGQNPLFTDYLNYPDGVNLMWNTAMPLPGLLLSPLTLVAGPIVAYNVLITLGVALSGWCAYLMLRRYVLSQFAAIAGGLLYGFSPYIVSHAVEHPNLPAAFIPPLMFVLLDEILVRQRRSAVKTGLVLGGLAFAQLMTSSELLATEMLVAILALGLLVLLYPNEVRQRAAHAAKALALAAGSGLALAALPLAFQFFGRQRVRSGALWGPDIFVTDLLGFVIPTDAQHLSPGWANEVTRHFTSACCGAEMGTYLGLPLLGLMIIVAARMWSRPLVRVTALLAAATALFSMGPHLHVRGLVTSLELPFRFLSGVPLVRNLLAARLMLYVYLAGAILLAVAVDRVLRREPEDPVRENESPLYRPILAAALAAVVLLPLLPRLTVPNTPDGTPAFFRSDAVDVVPEGSVALVAPFARDTNTSAPVLWQAMADMRFRMPSGYALGPDDKGSFSYLPVPSELSRTMERIQQGKGSPVLDASTRGVLVADMAARDVRSVIVGPMGNREAMVAFFRELLRSDPVEVGGVQLWLRVDPRRLA